jgi:hypothetical protein
MNARMNNDKNMVVAKATEAVGGELYFLSLDSFKSPVFQKVWEEGLDSKMQNHSIWQTKPIL